MHYRAMFDNKYLGSWDLKGRDQTVKIASVKGETLTAAGGKESKKPVVYFEGISKGLALNKTNAKIVANLYGAETAKWIGQRITIYPTQTKLGTETVDCIRIRPEIPAAKGAPPPPTEVADGAAQ